MKHLIYKELKLSINKFFFILPALLASLMLIPQWFYMIVFMYFFWISITNIHASYVSEDDMNFMSILPVSKKEIVTSRIIALIILEVVHIVTALIFAFIHNLLFGPTNFGLDVNFSLFGAAIFMYGLFNISFLPLYYKTAYFFGKPTILGSIVTLIFAFLVEFLSMISVDVRQVLEGPKETQLLVLGIGIIFGVGMTYIALKRSQKNFSEIQR